MSVLRAACGRPPPPPPVLTFSRTDAGQKPGTMKLGSERVALLAAEGPQPPPLQLPSHPAAPL
jgi:hypothetical protein